MPRSGVGVWVYPNTISDDSKIDCASVLFAMLSASTARSLPTGDGADGVLAEFPSPYGEQSFQEGFWWMSETSIYVRVELSNIRGGYTVAGLTAQVRAAVLAHFSALLPGQDVEQQEVLAVVTTIPGVIRANVTLGLSPGGLSDADVPLDVATFAQLSDADLEVL